MIGFIDFSILSWNVRGAASLRVHIGGHLFWRKLGYEPIAIKKAHGHAGGIWVLSSDSRVQMSVIDSHPQVITLNMRLGSDVWTCFMVYASPISFNRELLWSHLFSIRPTIASPWLLLGDFMRCCSLQKLGVAPFAICSNRASRFGEVLEKCILVDLGATGNKYTWHRNQNGMRIISKRLDRDCQWRVSFSDAFVENLCSIYSDHHPMLLRCGGILIARGARSFRFEAVWASYQDFRQVVMDTWLKGSHDVIEGLKFVRDDAVQFNEAVFGNVFHHKRLL